MKKLLCFILTATLVLTPASTVFAKNSNAGHQNNKKTTYQQNSRIKEKKVSFKINGSPVIKYGRYKLPISPITKGMGATVTFDKEKTLLTVVKGTITIAINFKDKTVTVNGVADEKSGIFTAKNEKKMSVLIKYIAKVLGIRTEVDKDEVDVIVPGLDFPTGVSVTPVGTSVLANTLNTSTLYMIASANVIAGQATGGKAELYVGDKLVATDSSILATDTTVTFTTADETPVNAELQAIVPNGGVVKVKLYNTNNQSVTSSVSNPTLVVDYAVPTITSVNSAVYSATGSSIVLNVTGAGAVGDKVDVTKISIYDTALVRSYQLTNTAVIGSVGVVVDDNKLLITLGSADKLGLSGFGTSTMILNVAAGSLLTDTAGNTSPAFIIPQAVPATRTN